MEVIIRQVRKHEIDDVYMLEKNVYKPINYPMFVLRQFYDLMPELFLVALNENNEILGYTQGGLNIENNEGWILSLATNQKHRGKGVGGLLSKKLIDRLKLRYIERILLTVHPENDSAVSLYTRMGFKINDEVQDYYGDGEPRFEMELRIDD